RGRAADRAGARSRLCGRWSSSYARLATRVTPDELQSAMPEGTSAPTKSALQAIQPFRWRIALTYGLTLTEDLLELSYPWATGLAINGLLAHAYKMIAPVMIAWVLHTAIGCGRQMYDTRLYTRVYNAVVIDTVLRQRQAGIEPTTVAARSGMSREFVTFF